MNANPNDGSWPKRTCVDKTHAQLMSELNPEGWTSPQWRAHKDLMDAGGLYAQRIHKLNVERHAWAEEQVNKDVSGRRVSVGMRIRMRREMNQTARIRFPAPDPLQEGRQT